MVICMLLLNSGSPEAMSISAIIVPPALEFIVTEESAEDFNDEDFSSFILPHIILWDPLKQFSRSFLEGMQCPNCSIK